MTAIQVPDEILNLLEDSALAGQSQADQVRSALAVHLFQEGLVSAGKAAALANVPRIEFELLLTRMGIPVVHYDELDQHGFTEAERPNPW